MAAIGAKQTNSIAVLMSANDPKRTLAQPALGTFSKVESRRHHSPRRLTASWFGSEVGGCRWTATLLAETRPTLLHVKMKMALVGLVRIRSKNRPKCSAGVIVKELHEFSSLIG